MREGGTGEVPRRLAGTSEADPMITEPHGSKEKQGFWGFSSLDGGL